MYGSANLFPAVRLDNRPGTEGSSLTSAKALRGNCQKDREAYIFAGRLDSRESTGTEWTLAAPRRGSGVGVVARLKVRPARL
jgi:hypothetical protein